MRRNEEHAVRVDQSIGPRIDNQDDGNPGRFGARTIMRWDLQILVEPANIDRHNLIMPTKPGLQRRELHDSGKEAAVEAPISAKIDLQQFDRN